MFWISMVFVCVVDVSSDKDWWWAVDGNGNEGYFPVCIVYGGAVDPIEPKKNKMKKPLLDCMDLSVYLY